MLSGGIPLKVVSDVLGHASIAITADVYGHVTPEVSREALGLSKALGASWWSRMVVRRAVERQRGRLRGTETPSDLQ